MPFYGITSDVNIFKLISDDVDEYGNMPLFIYCSIQIENYFEATKRKEQQRQSRHRFEYHPILLDGNCEYFCVWVWKRNYTRWLVMLYEALSMCKHPYANFLSEVCCFVSFRFVCSGARRRVDTKKPLSTSEPIDILRYNGLDSICIGIREHRKCYALNRIFGSSVWLRLCRATFRSKLFRILRLFTIAHIYLSMYKYIFHRFMIFIAVLGPSVFWLTEFIIYELLLLCIFYFSCSGGGEDSLFYLYTWVLKLDLCLAFFPFIWLFGWNILYSMQWSKPLPHHIFYLNDKEAKTERKINSMEHSSFLRHFFFFA